MTNYIILAHTEPKQLHRLVNRLNTSNSHFYIHVDRKTDIAPFLLKQVNIHFLAKREYGTWGGFGIVKATLNALEQIIKDSREGHCILLSGQDYPLQSNDAIHSFLAERRNMNFADVFPIPFDGWQDKGWDRLHKYRFNYSDQRGDYIQIPSIFSGDFWQGRKIYIPPIRRLIKLGQTPFILLKQRRYPSDLKPFGGSQWWAITTDTTKKVLEYIRSNPSYITYHQYTLLADEMFFQPLFYHFDIPLSYTLTYTNWNRPSVPLPVTFDENDFEELSNLPKDKLFARKFKEGKILDLLDEKIFKMGS